MRLRTGKRSRIVNGRGLIADWALARWRLPPGSTAVTCVGTDAPRPGLEGHGFSCLPLLIPPPQSSLTVTVLVLIPAFNEARAIGRVIGDIPDALVDEVVVVNNASTDETEANAPWDR